MKSNRKTKTIILLSLGIFFAYVPIFTSNLRFTAREGDITSNYNDNENLKFSAVSGKIHIDNNWTTTKSAGICSGNGTFTEPYVIEDLVIDAEGLGNGVLINNSNVYFKIENCTVYNSWGYLNAGIKLLNVKNSQLINNTVNNNYCGIFLEFSHNNTISGNLAYDNDYTGINVVRSGNNKILGNTAINNVDHGIYLGNTQLEIGPNKISSNNSISGNKLNNNGKMGLYVAYSDNNNISGNTAYDNRDGIRLIFSKNNNISGNTACNNEVGIVIGDGGSYNIISGNTANYNEYGLILRNGDFNTVSHNLFIKNDICVFEEECIGNVFENNYCVKDNSFELMILISSIIAGAVIGVTILLIVRQQRKRRG